MSEFKIGDTVVATITGEVALAGSRGIYIENTYGEVFVPFAEYSIEAVKKAEPVYEVGQLYRDVDNRLFYRTELDEWLWLARDGDYTFAEDPIEPLTKAQAVELPF